MARKKADPCPPAPMPIDERDAAMEWLAYVDDVRTGKRPPPMPTGLRQLDEIIYGMIPGLVVVIAGRPGMGKSALVKQLCRNCVSLDPSYAALLTVLEMSPEQNAARTLSGETRIGFGSMVRGKVTEADMTRLWAAQNNIKGGQFFLDQRQRSVTHYREHIREFKAHLATRGKVLKVVGLDYCQQMATFDGSREQNIAAISNMAKTIAVEEQVCFLLLSQLNRGLENRDDKRPIMADLRESGAIEQDADQVIMVYRPAVYSHSAPEENAELILRKNRWGELGTAEVHWNGRGVRFEE